MTNDYRLIFVYVPTQNMLIINVYTLRYTLYIIVDSQRVFIFHHSNPPCFTENAPLNIFILSNTYNYYREITQYFITKTNNINLV